MDSEQRIIVTGASGMIGSAVVQDLLARKFSVHIVSRDAGDLQEPSTLNKWETTCSDQIVHCAAMIPQKFGGDESVRAGEVNRRIDDNIIDLCRRTKARLIYISSASVYHAISGKITEDSPRVVSKSYEGQKAESENRMASVLETRAVSLRISAPYGLKQKFKSVIRIFIERALKNEPLIYYGTGERRQSFLDLGDACGAIAATISKPNASGPFNIAGSPSVSMKELAHMVRESVPGCRSEIRASGTDDPQENQRIEFDLNRALVELNWAPQISLREGIAKWISALKDSR